MFIYLALKCNLKIIYSGFSNDNKQTTHLNCAQVNNSFKWAQVFAMNEL